MTTNKFVCHTLRTDIELQKGSFLESSNRVYKCMLQKDGNFVLYNNSIPIWWTSTNIATHIILQSDGNLVIYNNEEPVWATNTAGIHVSHLILQDDGNLVLYDNSYAIWDTGTWDTSRYMVSNIITNKNVVTITTTLANNIISEKRRNNIINNLSLYDISIVFNHGILLLPSTRNNLTTQEIMFQIMADRIERFITLNYDYAILCDDDFYPCKNFLAELNTTIRLLPENWRSLHLCPGYLWGRKFRDTSKVGHLNPEYDMSNISYHNSGRFYTNCCGNLYSEKSFWLGGPIAVLLNKAHASNYLENFKEMFVKLNTPNDVILTKMLNNNDYICREPMLGYENEEGGTTRMWI